MISTKRSTRKITLLAAAFLFLSAAALWQLGLVDAAMERAAALTGAQNGDVNGDGSRDISDAVALLNWLFAGGPEPVPCSTGEEGSGEVDPFHDLVGYLNPMEQVLYVAPGHENAVISALDANPAPGDLFRMHSVTTDGQPYTLFFHPVTVEAPALFVQDDQPGIVLQNADYKVYKDAKCAKVTAGFTTACLSRKPFPGYESLEFLPKNRCKKGDGYCVEVRSVDHIWRTYDDSECKVLTNIRAVNDFSCKL